MFMTKTWISSIYLNNSDDIRESLAIGKTDAEATKYFLKQMDASYGGAWTTQIDWFMHDLNNLIKKGTGS